MHRLVLKLIISLLFCLITSTNIWAANRLIYEDFDDQSFAGKDLTIWDGDGTESYVSGIGGTGKALKLSGTQLCGDARLAWTKPPKPWPTSEIYFSGWVKIVKTGSDCTNYGWKMFYPRWSSPVDYLVSDIGTCRGVKDLNGTEYQASPFKTFGGSMVDRILNDGVWVKMEYHYDFSQSKVNIWYTIYGEPRQHVLKDWIVKDYSGKTIIFDPFSPSVIDWPGIKTHCEDYPCEFYRIIDNWEVWDGMPSGSTSTTSSSSTTSTTSSTSTTAPPPPGKPYVLD